jgi:GT2 family glycosyltransferase/glycosyltransferase involved in cell wall biosynthesis
MAVSSMVPQAAGSTPQTYLALGNIALSAKNYGEAISYFQLALKQTPSMSKIIEFNIKFANAKQGIKTEGTCPVQVDASAIHAEKIIFSTDKQDVPTNQSKAKKNASDYEGRLEKGENTALRGWAVNKKNKSEVFELSVFIDGVFFCKIKNNDYRADLQRAGKSSGRGGYNLTIPQDILDSERHTIRIEFPDGSVLASLELDGVTREISNDIIVLPVEEKVSVIVPIYNALDDVKVCIERLTQYTSKDVDVILINDASTDEAIRHLLEETMKKTSFRVYHNEHNLGFTKTVNRGIELAGSNDVILLNSDARVTPRWIQGFKRALATDHKIATVTAMSDRAGAFSAPNIGNDNDLPRGIKEEEYAVAFRRRAVGYYPTVPTGNGFCMYIRRSCINEIGSLDAEAFPRGYGEENDFCMRARAAGWRNVIDDRTYVFHDRSKSFGGEKDQLIKAGRAVIDSRYPDYSKAIQVFSQSPLISMARFNARKALDDCYKIIKPRALYVISTVTGGTPQTNRDLMSALNKPLEPWLFRCDSRQMTLYKVLPDSDVLIESHVLKEPVDPLTHESAEYDRVLFTWLSRYDFELVHVRHLAWHSLSVLRLAKKAGAKVIKSFHDFYTLCPTVKLIDGEGIFCGGNCTSSKNSCKAELWPEGSIPTLKNAWVKTWRDKFSAALNFCDAFVTTSESARKTIMEGLKLNKSIPFEVIEHGRDFNNFKSVDIKNVPTGQIKILVPGNLDDAKGLNVIRQLLAHDSNSILEFHLLGKCDVTIDDARVIKYGTYKREDFIKHVEKIQPHLGVVFSVWDETWCHTLTELWASGLPAVVFEYPTVAYRMKSSDAGWIATADTTQLYKLLTTICTNPKEYKAKLDNVKKWQDGFGLFNNIRYMAAQYLNLYKGKSGRDLKNIVAVVSPADQSLEKAPGSTHVRVWQKTNNSLNREVTYLRLTQEQLLAGIKLKIINNAILQRNVIKPQSWDDIKKYVEIGSFNYILDLDDDLLNVPEDKDKDSRYLNYRHILEDIINKAKVVFVSNNALSEKYNKYSRNINVEENKLSRNLWLSDFKNKDGFIDKNRGLYFGTYTHEEDFKLVLPALRAIYNKYPNFKLKVVGITNSSLDFEPWIEKVQVPKKCMDYERFVPWLREVAKDCYFGIAPLVENEFNFYKSYLKAMEYSALGLQTLATNFGDYSKYQITPIQLTENDEVSWFENVEKIIKYNKSQEGENEFIISNDIFICEASFDEKCQKVFKGELSLL